MRHLPISLALALLLPASAGTLSAAEVRPAAGMAPASPDSADAADPFTMAPLAPAQLAARRGGADTVSSDMRLNGTVAGNTAVNVASGMNTISTGSFSNATGLPVAIQNSGANVLIQNATIINIQFQ